MSASFSGLHVSRVRLFPTRLTAPTNNPVLWVPEAPDWLAALASAKPDFELRTQLGNATSDEYHMRRFDGLSGHAQAAIFECPVHADLVLIRLIGVFDAL